MLGDHFERPAASVNIIPLTTGLFTAWSDRYPLARVTISIQLLGQARQLAGCESFQLEAPADASVHDLLKPLLEISDPALANLLSDPAGRLRNTVLPILGDETIDPSASGLLKDGDTLTLLPPMSGG